MPAIQLVLNIYMVTYVYNDIVYCLESKTILTTNNLQQWHVSARVHAFRTYMVSDASIQTHMHIYCKLFTKRYTVL